MGISHSWNGTVLTITSDSGTSSADLKGDTGIRGPQGPAGEQYKPQYGLDYFTEAEKDAFLAEIDEHIEADKDELFMGEVRNYVDQTTVNAEYVDEYVNNYVRENAVNAAYVESYVGANAVNSTYVSNYVSANTAPNGYGLGTGCKWVASMDNIFENGWYQCDLGSMGYFVGIVTKYSDNSCIQHMWSIDTAGTKDIKEIQRHIVGNVIQPWEWINPPMIVGVEYRTTERWNGQPVYTMLINCGTMPTAGNTNRIEMPSNINGWIDKVLRVTGTDSSGDTIPYSWQGEYITEVSASRSAIYIYSSQDFSSNTAYVQIFYTRH